MFRLAGTSDRTYNVAERLDEMGWCVAHLLTEKGYVTPVEVEMSELFEMVGKAVMACFPDMSEMPGFARSTHYQVVLSRKVEKVAFAYIGMHGADYFRKMLDVQNDLYERRVGFECSVRNVRELRNANKVFERRYAAVADMMSYSHDSRVSRRWVRVAPYVRKATHVQ